MPITLRAVVELQLGCRLYYDCPLVSSDYKSDQFFKQYHGRYATFVGYCEKLVTPLDFKGRWPGRYINPDIVNVRFDGDQKTHNINVNHLVVSGPLNQGNVTLADSWSQDVRQDDLPHPVLFYPGDTVRFKKKPNEGVDRTRRIRQIFLGGIFTNDNIPRYDVEETAEEAKERIREFDEENEKRPYEQQLIRSHVDDLHAWNTAGEDIELVSRGNVWALYNDPPKLSFASNEDEATFWATDGIAHYAGDEVKRRALGLPQRALQGKFGLSLEDAWRVFACGEADIIEPCFSNPGDGPRFEVKKLHNCFGEHRKRLYAVTRHVWEYQLKQPAI